MAGVFDVIVRGESARGVRGDLSGVGVAIESVTVNTRSRRTFLVVQSQL